ncbi:MAG TPA: glycosyltransferase family 1 protein [Terriglobales bacterium]|jgi:glycosyltransferase involved in cell wall biosynthesis|nr:glycosyltransferase family 1 protein [Terriglobales bacterium]
MRLFIHALGASAGGGLTYLRNLLPQLAARTDVSVTVLAGNSARDAVSNFNNIEILDISVENRGVLSRFWWEQREIPAFIRKAGAEVLLSTGNFAVWNSPVPQILLSRNSLYTSTDFSSDLRRRNEYRMWADTRLKGYIARKSIQRAHLTLAPSEAFAQELRAWSGHDVSVLHHGFNGDYFFQDRAPLSSEIEATVRGTEGAARLLFVSHYNYYRNFETLLRAVALVKERRPSGRIRLLLTCELAPGKNPGSYRTEEASALLRDLKIEEEVVQLGAIPYRQLHHLYKLSDVYVSPAYTETFAHPLVEAMACGMPIVASDLPVHREITDGAGLFFDRFSPSGLADKITHLLDSPALRADLRQRGLRRAQSFSWKDHADRLVAMASAIAAR